MFWRLHIVRRAHDAKLHNITSSDQKNNIYEKDSVPFCAHTNKLMCFHENISRDIYCDKLSIFTYETTLHKAKCKTYKIAFSELVIYQKYQENESKHICKLINLLVPISHSVVLKDCQSKCYLQHVDTSEGLPKCYNTIIKNTYNLHHFYVSKIYLNLHTNNYSPHYQKCL